MAVPKQRKTKSRRNQRRAHIFIKPRNLIPCPKCGKLILSHIVCPNCGSYKGVEVIDVMKKLTEKEKKKKEKEIAAKEKESKKDKPLSMEELSRKWNYKIKIINYKQITNPNGQNLICNFEFVYNLALIIWRFFCKQKHYGKSAFITVNSNAKLIRMGF